jgi:hypothetical protein
VRLSLCIGYFPHIVQVDAKTALEALRAIYGAIDMPQETSRIGAKAKTPSYDSSLGVGPRFLFPGSGTRRVSSEVAKLVNELQGFIFPD